ncbi:MAG: PEP-CTERM sorting domain-containing protein [Gemmatimonadaceae bacterium]|nr:PEP-CTERM sorting domain-containing protein [Acetobacteraceae bacterium]
MLRNAAIAAAISSSMAMATAAAAAPNLVADPSFEVADGSWAGTMLLLPSDTARTGSNVALTACVGHGCVSTLGEGGYVQQTLATTAGQAYTLKFYVGEDAGPTSEISVFWDGVLVADVLNPANSSLPGYVSFAFGGLLASSGATSLELHGRQDPSFIFFDDVEVTVSDVPEPRSLLALAIGLAGLGLTRVRGWNRL